MRQTAQYVDLTEVENTTEPSSDIFLATGTTDPLPGARWDAERVPFRAKMLKTEFGFAVDVRDGGKKYLQEAGFKKISSCTNWWPSHDGEHRKLSLWWIENPDADNLNVAPRRRSWCDAYTNSDTNKEYKQWQYQRLRGRMAGSGCGMMLDSPFKTLLKNGTYWKFFCLLRQPIEISKSRQMWLDKMHFTHIATGKVASYWTNGFSDKEWTVEAEVKRWGNWASWHDNGRKPKPPVWRAPDYAEIIAAQDAKTNENYKLEMPGPWGK